MVLQTLNGLKRLGGPVRPADRGFTGDPTSLAGDNILHIFLSVRRVLSHIDLLKLRLL